MRGLVTAGAHLQMEPESDLPGNGVPRTSVMVARTTAGKGATSALRFGAIHSPPQYRAEINTIAAERARHRIPLAIHLLALFCAPIHLARDACTESHHKAPSPLWPAFRSIPCRLADRQIAIYRPFFPVLVASGSPAAGYPGWSMREVGPWREGTALPGETRETTAKRVETQHAVSLGNQEGKGEAGGGDASRGEGIRTRAPTGR